MALDADKSEPPDWAPGTDSEKTSEKKNSEQYANIFSRIFFCFLIPFLYRGCFNSLKEDDLYPPMDQHESAAATRKLTKAWEDEQRGVREQSRKPSLFRAVIRLYGWRVMQFGVLLLVEEALKCAQPLFMGRLIRYFRSDAPLSTNEALIAAAGVALTSASFALIHHPYFYGLQKIGLELKVATSGMVMEKGVRLSSAALHKTTVGHMVNLLSTDVNKFDMVFCFFHQIWIAPLILIAYSYLLWQEIGVASMAGFLAIFLLVPIQGFFSKKMGNCRREIAKRTDKRISVMNEILTGIRAIKMYAWENAFSDIVADLRGFEMKKVRENAMYQSLVMGLFWSTGKLVVLVAALTYVFLGNQLTAERIFVASALYNSCRLPITLFLPFGIQFVFEGRVSLRRVQDFLELEAFGNSSKSGENGEAKLKTDNEMVSLVKENGDSKHTAIVDCDPKSKEPIVELENFSATWDAVKEGDEPGVAVRGISFTAKPGQLIAVIGPVGAGKSSLLSSLLRETRPCSGRLCVRGKIGYAPQEAWCFSGTIRDNVLFGEEFDPIRYEVALAAASLDADVHLFPRRDATLVGERGAALSGGQRARLNLARALYRDADIYLLDDPLSAVDAAVGRAIYKKCISTRLRDKIVVLVTHQLQYLENADLVLMLKDGRVFASGTLAQLRESGELFAEFIQETERTYGRALSEASGGSVENVELLTELAEMHNEAKDLNEVFTERSALVAKDGASLTSRSFSRYEEKKRAVEEDAQVSEDRAEGAVEWRIYAEYVKAMCATPFLIPPLFVFVVAVQAMFNVVDWWLSKWTNAVQKAADLQNGTWNPELARGYSEDGRLPFLDVQLSLKDYQNVFTILTLSLVVVSVLRCIWFRVVQTLASSVLHKRMFNAVVNTYVSFFDTNPIGRILNRFSKDVSTMDDQLAFVFFEFIMGTLNFLGIVVVILALNPLVFLPTLPLVLLFTLLRVVYLASSRDIKRLEATTRSPLYSHISATMNGLTTVRAFMGEERAVQLYHKHMNLNTSAFYMSLAASRWFAIYIDVIVAIFITAVAFFSVLTPATVSSGEVALMLVYAVQLTGFFSWIMRQSAELQNGMVSVERIVHYAELESEHTVQRGRTPPKPWPQKGHILFRDVSLRYGSSTEYALRHIHLDIQPREKIGIVGRTGAGKSSLLRALFHLDPFEGAIIIDDIPTKDVPLKELRRRLAIIPQDPVLFLGTLRRNLDPFDEFSDDKLWQVLEQVELTSAVQQLGSGLSASMQEGGSNFSVGQRQLICLARALLRHSTVLVLDEATANVDPQTDALIQKTIKEKFASSTVLTIAHRLHTVMDSDRVLVLSQGNIVEFAHAHELLEGSSGVGALKALVNECGSRAAADLHHIASKSYEAVRKKLIPA